MGISRDRVIVVNGKGNLIHKKHSLSFSARERGVLAKLFSEKKSKNISALLTSEIIGKPLATVMGNLLEEGAGDEPSIFLEKAQNSLPLFELRLEI